MSTDSGILIVFEGIDGAGKTTQVSWLKERLEQAGEKVLISKEPTDGPWGMKLRQSASSGRLPFEDELDAFIKDREEHLENKVRPALLRGEIVILDRYFYSTIAYQGIRTEDAGDLEDRVRKNVLEPDAVFVLDLDPEIAATRISQRDGAHNEFEGLEDQKKIRTLFKALCEADSSLIEVDGTVPPEYVGQSIASALVDGVLLQKRCAKSYGCDDQVNCAFDMTKSCAWARIKRALGVRGSSSRNAAIVF